MKDNKQMKNVNKQQKSETKVLNVNKQLNTIQYHTKKHNLKI